MPQYSGIWTLGQAAQAIKNQDWAGVPPTVVEYLAVAGGGSAGSRWHGGGGGAGGVVQGYAGITPETSYFVTVGAGGAASAGTNNFNGNVGQNSVFDATSSGAFTGRIIAIGGGGGGAFSNNGIAGGSGGGAGDNTKIGDPGTSGQGNAGGSSYGIGYGSGGGGGGAGTVGLNTPNSSNATTGGNGGAGIASDITGTRVVYGGGGGGAGASGVGGKGGVGGGGDAGNLPGGYAGQPNTGGGGGSATGNSGNDPGGSGGSGIVVIRYPGNTQYFTGGTLNYSNGHIVHTFYSSGVLAPSAPRLFASPDYQIQRSIRFNNPDGPLLERTGSSGGNRQTWTWSGWVKRSKLNSSNTNRPFLFGASDRASGSAYLQFGLYGSDSDIDCLNFNEQSGGGYNITTEAKFRDTSAWYHVVCAYDTTQTVASDRVKIYVNGILQTITSGSTYPPQNTNGYINYSAFPYLIGAYTTSYLPITFDGYMAEVNFVDGQQLTPASFGYTEPSTGVWTPLQYTGSYGTRGFYLNFADNSNTTAATLGKDLSGNGNNFTPYNFSVSAGVGNDSFVDSPTNYGVDTGAGGEVRGNYCTMNPLDKGTNITLANGNLQITSATAWTMVRGTIGMTTGKWYWEAYPTTSTSSNNFLYGISKSNANIETGLAFDANGWAYYKDGTKYTNGVPTAYGATWSTGDVIGVAFDADAGTLAFYKNGTSQGTAFSGLTSGPYFPAVSSYTTEVSYINFGQRPFSYTAPSGYKALCTQNLPESQAGKLPNKYFGVATYAADGGNQRPIATGVDMTTYGGLAWFKSRNVAAISYLIDTVRGLTKYSIPNNNTAEDTYDSGSVVKPYGLDINSGSVAINQPGQGYNYVMWNWAAGGAAVTNTAGSITSSVSANPAAGFSIVTYTGAAANATVGHGLGVAPKMVIYKARSTTGGWFTYHTSVGPTKELELNSSHAEYPIDLWQNTNPSSTVFYLSNNIYVNNSGTTYVAYCWAEIAGYSKFGSYVGNSSNDGAFIYCGFKPAFILTKDITTDSFWWEMVDSKRSAYNPSNKTLYANVSDAEYTSSGYDKDLLSNGFKIRGGNGGQNSSGSTYIFAAFAESPFKYARAR